MQAASLRWLGKSAFVGSLTNGRAGNLPAAGWQPALRGMDAIPRQGVDWERICVELERSFQVF